MTTNSTTTNLKHIACEIAYGAIVGATVIFAVTLYCVAFGPEF